MSLLELFVLSPEPDVVFELNGPRSVSLAEPDFLLVLKIKKVEGEWKKKVTYSVTGLML